MTSIQPTLLLIANHPQFTYLIERYGARSGCLITSADTVERAMSLMRQSRPALVLLLLSGWLHDGWSILREVRPHCAPGNIPIAIISAVVDEARARAEGASYWLWQPVMYSDFLAVLIASGVVQHGAAHFPRPTAT